MSQRPPRNNRSGKNTSRKTRTQSQTKPRQSTPDSARTQASSAGKDASRPSERRQAQRESAIRKERQKKQTRMLIGGVGIAVLIAAVLIFINRPTNDAADIDYDGLAFAPPPITETSATPAASPQAGSTQPYTGAVLGDPNAPVSFIIYADYQCPFCVQFHEETYPQIIDDFVRDGQVKIEFREYPALGEGPLTDDGNESAQAAEAAMCAAEQDSYMAYHDKLYANWNGENQGAFSNDRLRQFAEDVGLDVDAFNTCLDSGRYEPAITQSLEEGRTLGVTATPMFVIDNGNGQPNIVSQTDAGYDLLKRQIQTAIDTAP